MTEAGESLTGRRTVFAGRVVTLELADATAPGGRQWTQEIVQHAAAAAVVAVDSSEHVLLIRQPRPTVGEVLLELPAGLVEAGEEPLRAAQRELAEETGAVAQTWQLLTGFYSSPGYSTEWLWIYLATNLTSGTQRLDPNERIDVVPTPVDTLPSLLGSGQIRNATALVGLLTYLRVRESGEAFQPPAPPDGATSPAGA